MKAERGSIKYLIILILAISLFGLILYPLFDFIYDNFITNDKFIYSIENHILKPFFVGVTLGITLWIIDKRKK